MDIQKKNDKLSLHTNESDSLQNSHRNAYVTPRLTEYGTFTKLTGAGAQAGADGNGMSNQCL